MTLKYLGEEPTADEMGRACGMYEWEEKCMYSFGGETLQEIDNLEDLGVGG
jgi:hypothetical protein